MADKKSMIGVLALATFTFIAFPTVPSALYGQDVNTLAAFDRIGYSGVNELTNILTDNNVRMEEKNNAVYRLAELGRESRKKDKLGGKSDMSLSAFYNPIVNILQTSPDSHTYRDPHILRIAACDSLGRFANLDGAEGILPALGKALKDTSEHEEVRITAARSLGRFQKYSAAATDQLVAALNIELTRGPQAKNVTVTTGIVNGLGRLQDKRAFIPLMQVIRSQFNADVKRAAQMALENITWE